MKKEDMYNAVSSISSDILDQTDAYMATKRAPKTIRWKRWIAVAACFALMLCASLPLFPGKESVSPFIITAYAMDADGEIVGTPIEVDQSAPMTRIELPNGMGGFLFSVDLEDKNAESQLNPFVLVDGSRNEEIEDIINNYTEEKGKAYFYYAPGEAEDVDGNIINVSYTHTEANGAFASYVLQIVNDNGEYTVTLKSAESHPVNVPNEGN